MLHYHVKFVTEFLKFGGHSCSNCQGGLPSYTHTGLDSPKSEAALFPGDLIARLLSILVCVFHWGQAGEWLSLAIAADDGSQGPWMAGGPPLLLLSAVVGEMLEVKIEDQVMAGHDNQTQVQHLEDQQIQIIWCYLYGWAECLVWSVY